MKARKAMALAMTAAMVGGLMTVPVMAEENAELLPGGGSNIIYCITPSTSNPFFNTEQVIAKEKAEELGVTPKMKIEGYAIAGFDAELMGYSPKFSSEKLANKLGVDLKSIDMFEINEAFASQAYAVSRDLGLDPEKVNIYGGGISIGHPIGATGAMLTVKVMYELMRTDKKDAMISMCIGGGQGISMYFTKCE